ncbi:MAG: hypothetical protein ACUVRN_05470, partial [Candidatus Caldatribacteriaceae bacterium]
LLHIPKEQKIPSLENQSQAYHVFSSFFLSSSYPWLSLAESHVYTAFICETLSTLFPTAQLFLLVLDAHLDIFSNQTSSSGVHRGNFIRYLLERKVIKENRLFVTPPQNPFQSVKESLSKFGKGFYYLSWDLDFGFPQYACFSPQFRVSRSDLQEIFQTLNRHFHKKGRYLVGMDIVEINLHSHPPKIAFQIATLLAQFQTKNHRPLPYILLDRFSSSKYA